MKPQYSSAAWGTITGVAGIIAPVLFVGSFFVQGLIRTNYDANAMYISALSIGDYGWIQSLNFILLGVLLGLFACRTMAHFKTGKASKAGPALLFVSSISFLLSGPFVMDAMGTPLANASTHGLVHGIFGGIVFFLMPVTCFVFFRRFRHDPQWQFMSAWTLTMGIVISVALVVFTISTKNPLLENQFRPYAGLLQRSVLVPYMIWLFTFGIAAVRRRSA